MIGRPRQFDETEALERAMQVFWDRGYEGAGMAELLEAMQISRQSCYNTFGEKRELFLKAIQHYGDTAVAQVCQQMAASNSPIAGIRGFLEKNAKCACTRGSRGCMVVNSIVEFGGNDPDVAKILRKLVSRIQATLRRTLEAAQEAGELSEKQDPQRLAEFITHVAFGFSSIGKIKMCKESSEAIVNMTLNALDAS